MFVFFFQKFPEECVEIPTFQTRRWLYERCLPFLYALSSFLHVYPLATLIRGHYRRGPQKKGGGGSFRWAETGCDVSKRVVIRKNKWFCKMAVNDGWIVLKGYWSWFTLKRLIWSYVTSKQKKNKRSSIQLKLRAILLKKNAEKQ